MKQTKTTLKELTAAYRAVLRHGILCNAIALGLIATAPAMADIVIASPHTYTGHNAIQGAVSSSNGGNISTTGSGLIEFDSNKSTDHGAGLYYKNGGAGDTVVFGTDVAFTNNEVTSASTSGSGAGIFVSGGNVSLLGASNTFTGNEMNATIGSDRAWKVGGGAIANQSYVKDSGTDAGTALDATMVIGKADGTSTNTFSGNTSSTNGGAIMNRAVDTDGNATLTIKGTTTFGNNTAEVNGGAIYNAQRDGRTATVNLNDGSYTFIKNKAKGNSEYWGNGGAIYNSGNMTLTNATFGGEGLGNTAENGGAIFNGGTMTVAGNFISNSSSNWGGAVYNTGNLTISDNSVFNGNTTASVGGAITNALGASVLTIGSDVEFTGNVAGNDGGAIGNYAGATLVNGTTFTGNRAQTVASDKNAIGGGAISMGAESSTKIAGATFVNNESGFNGGALGTRHALSARNDGAKMDVTGSTFTGNKALGTTISTFSHGSAEGGNGGALDNHFYNSDAKAGYAYVAGSTFSENEAIRGGAVYNDGTADSIGNKGKLYLSDSNFNDNIASDKGGAIYNSGELVVAAETANVLFSGNKANGVDNDIYNTGTLSLNAASGKVISLTGGITGSADSIASNIVNVAGDGYVSVENTLTNQTVNNSGDLRIDADLTGTTIANAEGAKMSIARDITVDGNSELDGYNGELAKDIEVQTGGDLTINNANFASGAGKLVNKQGATMRINDSFVGVAVDNSGNLISDPTTYAGTVTNSATGISSFDADTFAGTATLVNAGIANLSNGVTFDTGASITGAGTTNLVSGYTHFNNTANTNTINVASGANFDGALVGGTVNTQNGTIDTIAGSVSGLGAKVAIDVNTDTLAADTFAAGTSAKIASLNVNGSYGSDYEKTIALGSGLSIDEDTKVNGGYYTKVEVDGANLKFSDKLINESGLYTKLGTWSAGNYIKPNVDMTHTGSDYMTVGGALTALDTAIGAKIAADGNYIKASTTNSVNQNISALDTQVKANADAIGTKQDTIDSTHKLAANLVAFSDAQQNAIDSGITSAKVATYDGYATTIAGKLTKEVVNGDDHTGFVNSNSASYLEMHAWNETNSNENTIQVYKPGSAESILIQSKDGGVPAASIRVNTSGAYYTKGSGAVSANDEIATKGNIADVETQLTAGATGYDIDAKSLKVQGVDVLTANNMAGAYTGTTLDDARAYVGGTNAGKIATVGTTAALVEDLFEDKQTWVDNNLGIVSAHDNAVGEQYAGTHYLTSATTLTGADKALDAAIATKQDAITTTNKLDGSLIADASVDTAQLKNGAVTTDKIADGTITFADLNADMVATSTTVNLASPSDTKLVTEKAVVDGITNLVAEKEAWVNGALGIDASQADAVNKAYTTANAGAGTNYLNSAHSLTAADVALDTAIKANANAIATLNGNVDTGGSVLNTVRETAENAKYTGTQVNGATGTTTLNAALGATNTQVDTNTADIAKIVNGTTVVGKAYGDEDGNNIKATYATKTEVTTGVTAVYNKAHNWAENLLGLDVDENVEDQLQHGLAALGGTNNIAADTITGALHELDTEKAGLDLDNTFTGKNTFQNANGINIANAGGTITANMKAGTYDEHDVLAISGVDGVTAGAFVATGDGFMTEHFTANDTGIELTNASDEKMFFVNNSGNMTVAGNASVGGDLAVTGATTLTGLLTANGGITTTTLATSGNVTLGDAAEDTVTVNGSMKFAGDPTVNAIDDGTTAQTSAGTNNATTVATVATVLKSGENAAFTASTANASSAALNGATTIGGAINNVATAVDTNTTNIAKVLDGDALKNDITSATGTSTIWNEESGGGARYVHTDGLESFVGVNNGGTDGLAAQIYADKWNGTAWEGAKIDVTNGGIYYTVGSDSFADRAVAANEIATIGTAENGTYTGTQVNGATGTTTLKAALGATNTQVDTNTAAITTLNANVDTDGSVLNTVRETAENAKYTGTQVNGATGTTTLKAALDATNTTVGDIEHISGAHHVAGTNDVATNLVALDTAVGDLAGMTAAHVTPGADVATNLGKLSVAIDDALTNANTYTDQRVESLDKEMSAGVAGAVALSSVAVSGVERGEVSVGAGYGYFNGQSAAAFGAAMGLSDRWSVNAGAGISNADVSFRAGTNYKFKLF